MRGTGSDLECPIGRACAVLPLLWREAPEDAERARWHPDGGLVLSALRVLAPSGHIPSLISPGSHGALPG